MDNNTDMFFLISHIYHPEITLMSQEEVLEEVKKIDDPNRINDQGYSYLHFACSEHNMDIIRILLELGADPNLPNCNGWPAIISAIGSKNENNPEILKIMLSYGLDLNRMIKGKTLKTSIEEFPGVEYKEIMDSWENSDKTLIRGDSELN